MGAIDVWWQTSVSMKAIATNVGNNTNSYANSEPTIVISDLMMPTPRVGDLQEMQFDAGLLRNPWPEGH